MRTSLGWSYGGQAFTFIVTFASSVIVARLLGPREMGVFAIAMATYGIISIFTSLDIGTYLLREGEMTKALIRRVYTVHTAMNLLLALLTFGAGAITAYWGGEREIGAVLMLSAVGPLLGIFEFVPSTLYRREMNYGVLTRVGMVRVVITSVTIVACAYGGLGALSPVVGPLVAGVYSATYYNIRRRRELIFRPTREGLKPIVVFGFQMMSIGGVASLTQRLSEIILGRMLGLAALGLYSRAATLASLVWSNVYGLATGVLFVKMSDDLRDKGTLRDTFVLSIRLITAVIWPLVIGLAVLARPAIHILYGEQWMGAAAPLSILMIGQFVALAFGMNWELFVLRRETPTLTRYELIRAVIGLGSFAVGSLFSVTAAAGGRLIESISGYLLYRPHIDRLAETERGEIERVLGESLLLTAIAVAPAFGLMLWKGWAADTSPLLIAAAVALGGAGWFAVLVVRDHPLVAELRKVLDKLGALRGANWSRGEA
ncbi:oligosaccharide flippase family protein [uncultured Sphingomonas sp.]|uniref:oligosaccharide flippase family protein n=1 Tax=uncultured Sphingomonas sp. TaxID=158754 RepID=UPI0035CC6C7F